MHEFYPADYSAHAPSRAATQRPSRRHRDPWDDLPEIGSKRLLDFGCGSGAYLLRQKERGWTVTGVEPSSDAVGAARRQRLNVIEGTIPGVEFPDGAFDVITVMAVIGCVPDPLATLRVLHRLLAPGGRIVFSVHNAGSRAAELFGPHWQGWDLPRQQTHFTSTTLKAMIQTAGFALPTIIPRRRTSRWRASARARAASTGGLNWKLMAASRNLCSALATIYSRGDRCDELIAVSSR
jgi:SAM-dependent methyltransferase